MENQKLEILLIELISLANKLPQAGEEYEFYSTSSSKFRSITQGLDKRINVLLEQIGGNAAIVRNEEKLLELIADLREKSHVAFDQAKGLSNTVEKLQTAPSSTSAKTVGRLVVIDGLARPQDSFADAPIDNSSLPFRPKLSSKPHFIVPLDESLQLERTESLPVELAAHLQSLGKNKKTKYYRNPYEHEIRVAADENAPKWLWSEDVQFELRSKDVNQSKKHRKNKDNDPIDSLAKVPFTYVDTIETFEGMLAHLMEKEKHTAIAVDLEHHSYRSFQGLTCVMQISTAEQDFVIDALKLRSSIPRLLPIFDDPSIVKVLHGSDYDVEWLQKDFGLYLVALFDTGQAARILGYDSAGLAYAMDRHCHVQANKTLQLADWRLRPLTPDMLKYAREDTHYLLGIFDVMRRELLKLGKQTRTDAVQKVLERSADIASKAYEKPFFDPEGYLDLYQTSTERPTSQEKAVARALFAWRDSVAREKDESCEYVLSSRGLLRIAKVSPQNQDQLLRELDGIKGSPLLRSKLAELIEVISSALENQDEEQQQTASSTRVASTTTTKSSSSSKTIDEASVQVVSNEFYCGVNSDGGQFKIDAEISDILKNNSVLVTPPSKSSSKSSASSVSLIIQVVSDGLLKSQHRSAMISTGHMAKLRAIDAKIASMAEAEMLSRMENIELVKARVENILQEASAFIAANEDEEMETESAPQSLRDRFQMKSAPAKIKVVTTTTTTGSVDQVEGPQFQYTREMAVKAGAIAPVEEDAGNAKKKQRKSRWGDRNGDDDEDDHAKNSSNKAGGSTGAVVGEKKKNPFILRPGGKSFAARSTTYFPK